jgi:hypothetical protein
VPRRLYPDSGALAGAATPAERQAQAHATALVRFRDFSTTTAKLRKLALESIGDTNLGAIRDANLRLHHATANFIIVSMDALHGTFTEADINAFLEAPNAKLKSVTALDAHNTTFNKTLAKLLRAGSPVGPFAAHRSHVATLPGSCLEPEPSPPIRAFGYSIFLRLQLPLCPLRKDRAPLF